MLELSGVDVVEIATALADQTGYDHRWLLDPRTGQVAFWTSDTGIDGENPVEIDELDLIPSRPHPAVRLVQHRRQRRRLPGTDPVSKLLRAGTHHRRLHCLRAAARPVATGAGPYP